ELIEELFRHYPFGFSTTIGGRPRNVRQLAPIHCPHFSVELFQRVDDDLVYYRLYGFAVLGSIVHEDARDDVGERRRRVYNALYALGRFAFPAWSYNEIVAGFRAVGFAELAELVRARVVHGIDPETLA